jgi:cytochrome c peroxidase
MSPNDSREPPPPIFRLVDGSTCPSDDVSTLCAKKRAYKLLTEKGLIRVGFAVPATAEFAVTAIDDPYGCSTNPETGSGILSMYRRPLPTTNAGFLSTVMWDGRENTSQGLAADLRSQARDATLGHALPRRPQTPS